VLGDATIAAPMPKSGFVASSHAKHAVACIAASLAGRAPPARGAAAREVQGGGSQSSLKDARQRGRLTRSVLSTRTFKAGGSECRSGAATRRTEPVGRVARRPRGARRERGPRGRSGRGCGVALGRRRGPRREGRAPLRSPAELDLSEEPPEPGEVLHDLRAAHL
jgi:hypothetical protein